MAKPTTKASAFLISALLCAATPQLAVAGIFSFFHHSNCDDEECCNQCQCECETVEPRREHCCCLCPPCPPEGTVAFSVAVELNAETPFALREDQKKLAAKKDQSLKAAAKDECEKQRVDLPPAPAAEDEPECNISSFEEVCTQMKGFQTKQASMNEQLKRLERDLTRLTIDVRALTEAAKRIPKPADAANKAANPAKKAKPDAAKAVGQ